MSMPYGITYSTKISTFTAQKMKFSIKDFLSKCNQIRIFMRIWAHLLKKSLMENFIFCAVFGNSAIFVHFSRHPLWICSGAWSVHFTVPAGRRGALFSWGDNCTHLATHSSKRFKPLSITLLPCLSNASKKQSWKIIDLSLVLLV